VLTRESAARNELIEHQLLTDEIRSQLVALRLDAIRRLLVDTCEALATSSDPRSSARSIAHAAVTGLADWCLVDLVDRRGTSRRLAAAHADPGRQATVEQLRLQGAPDPGRYDLVWQVLRSGRALVEPEMSDTLRRALTHDAEHGRLLERLGFASLLIVPLKAGDQILGAITLVRGPSTERFGRDDLALADAWARECALALASLARSRAERRAHLASERLAEQRTTALDQIADPIVIADYRGHVEFMNPAARTLFGAAESASLVALLTRVRSAGGHTGPFEVHVRRPDGAERYVEAQAAPLRNGRADHAGAVLVVHDVTARREGESRRDESFANASHDLRTPVAAIAGAIEVFLRDAPPGIPPALYHMLLIIEQEAARLRALLDDVLELTSVDAGRVRLRLIRRDLRAVARAAARGIEPLAAKRHQHLTLDLPKRPLRGTVDVQRLERALLNLLSNAHEYAPEDGTITLRVRRTDSELLFEVRDDGPGISAADQVHIFERFYRGRGAVGHRGSGLGLPIARAMVELQGGRLWAESAPGSGTTFIIALPA